jgi:hypothetical protein
MGALIEGVRNAFPVLGGRLPYGSIRESHMSFFFDGMALAFAIGLVVGAMVAYTLWRSLPLWRTPR